MSLRNCAAFLVLLLLPSLTLVSRAQQPPAAPATPVAPTGATVHGTVEDPDDAIIPGATVTLLNAAGKGPSTPSKSDGTFSFRGVAAGTYTLSVSAPGFAVFMKPGVVVATGASINADVKMALQTQSQTVNVTRDTVQLSFDPVINASATVITGDALNALSDDPDELSAELTALAGPSAGPNGGQIYIDGFTGGQLPPKSSILAIRINQNPFSAQYDQLGYGRIEIITKPGTDKFHGGGSIQYQNKVFNTSTPFLGPANVQPAYHTLFGFGNLDGTDPAGHVLYRGGDLPRYREQQHHQPAVDLQQLGDLDDGLQSGRPGTCSANPYPTTARAVAAPNKRWEINPRVDMMIGAKNTLTIRYGYESGTSTNPGSNNSLTTQGSSSTSAENTIQVSDTQLISDRIINETRFEYQRDTSSSTPVNPATTVSVSGYFTAHGTGGGNINSNTSGHVEFQNYTSIQLTKNFIRLGGRLRTSANTITSNAGQNGTCSTRTCWIRARIPR